MFNYSAVPENIHTHPKEGHWEFQGGGGSQTPNFLKESMKLNWKFLGVAGVQTKKPSMEEVWIYSGTTHYKCILYTCTLTIKVKSVMAGE